MDEKKKLEEENKEKKKWDWKSDLRDFFGDLALFGCFLLFGFAAGYMVGILTAWDREFLTLFLRNGNLLLDVLAK